MGVNGLWRLIEPSGKPVPVETLENQVLAVDVSIWLHQATKGFQDATGHALPNAHLLGLFHRLCKLLFYKIRPVFVFDGGIPHLKKQTIVSRRQQKGKAEQAADRMREKLLKNLIKHNAVKNILGSQAWQSEVSMPRARSEDDMFLLPPPTENQEEEEEEETKSYSGSESEEDKPPVKYNDLHAVDVKSVHFRSLPADMRHDILVELKETRKQSSWGRLHEIPKESNEFSSYQMKRLLKRRSVQVSLEEAEKEMGGKTLSLAELEELMTDNGIVTDSDLGKRIASDNTTRYIFINGSKVESITSKEGKREQIDPPATENIPDTKEVLSPETAEKIQETKKVFSPVTSKTTAEEVICYDDYEYDDDGVDDGEWDFKFSEGEEEGNEDLPKNLHLAKNFMFENSGLTQSQILAIIKTQSSPKKGGRKPFHSDMPSTSKMNFDDVMQPGKADLNTKQDLSDKNKASSSNINKESNSVIFPSTSKTNFDDVIQRSYDLSTRSSEEPKEKAVLISDKVIVSPIVLPSTSKISEKSSPPSDLTQPLDEGFSDTSNRTEILNSVTDSSAKVIPSAIPIEILEDTVSQNESESESDAGFVEVDDKSMSVSDQSISEKKHTSSENVNKGKINDGSLEKNTAVDSNKSTCLEVVIEPSNLNMEDDIFADIFLKDPSDEQTTSTEIINLDNENLISVKENVQSKDVTEQNTSLEQVVSLRGNSEKNIIHTQSESPTNETQMISTVAVVKNSLQHTVSSQLEVKSSSSSKLAAAKNAPAKGEAKQKAQTEVASSSRPLKNTNLEDIIEVDEERDETTNELPKPVLDAVAAEKLQKLQASIEDDHYRLMVERGKQDRLAASITDQMYSEAQELLQLFGVPYIVAPMEAEAQCAFLDAIQLTDGTITDDSDIWLFGGRQVYKNFFNQKKHVLMFKATDIQHYFKLSRQEMILLALLVGSDYTVGLQGIGPVTALEILATFPPKNSEEEMEDETQLLVSCMQNFRTWLATGKAAGPVKVALRNKIKDLKIHAGFPSRAVIEAYLRPKVDESRESFSWNSPDLTALRKFALEKFGWSQNKTDSILLPVIKKLNERTNQQTLDSFVRRRPKLPLPEGRVSKRVQSAIDRMGAEDGSSSNFEVPALKIPKLSRGTNQRGRSRGRAKQGDLDYKLPATASGGNGRGRLGDLNYNPLATVSRPTARRGRGRPRDVTELRESSLNYKPEDNLPKPEFILQREKDKINALKTKLKAIEIYRKSKHGLDRTKPQNKIRKTIAAPNLSDSSDSD